MADSDRVQGTPLTGKTGSICTWGDGKSWAIWVGGGIADEWTKAKWTSAKKRLAFCTVTQDGDIEGCLRLHQLPTREQAAVIRDVLSLRKRREDRPETLERIRERGKWWAFDEKPPSAI
jgi:hypothetical protein